MSADLEALSGLHILVVEDDVNGRAILQDLFRYFGAHVTTAHNARDGLLKLRQFDPDIVVADMRLGDHNASWLLREARKISCQAAFVAVTAYDFEERALRAQGFAALLRKPLHRDALVTTVLSATKRG
jgi:two-component system response regulator RegA